MTKELSIVDLAKKQIMKNERAFEAVLPESFDVKKFMATFCLEVQKNPDLALCNNLIEVARDIANFGLIIGGLANQAHLIPYKNWKTKEYTAQLIIGYKGYIVKLEEAGYSVEVEIVTNEEVAKGHFEELRGTETKIIHRPIRSGIRDRESIALAYCIIKGKNLEPIISVLSKEEIEEIGKTSQWVDGDNGKKTKENRLSNVWLNKDRTTDFGQQCIKTVIRNAVKKVNLSIANEMSTYEGKRDEQRMQNVTPSKTANIPENLTFDETIEEKAKNIAMAEGTDELNKWMESLDEEDKILVTNFSKEFKKELENYASQRDELNK